MKIILKKRPGTLKERGEVARVMNGNKYWEYGSQACCSFET